MKIDMTKLEIIRDYITDRSVYEYLLKLMQGMIEEAYNTGYDEGRELDS